MAFEWFHKHKKLQEKTNWKLNIKALSIVRCVVDKSDCIWPREREQGRELKSEKQLSNIDVISCAIVIFKSEMNFRLKCEPISWLCAMVDRFSAWLLLAMIPS